METEERENGNQDEIQNGINQMEYIKKQIEVLRDQRETLNSIIADYNSSKDVVIALESGTDEDVMIPLGGMTLIKAKLSFTDRIMVDQGLGVYTEEKLDSAKERINERIEKVKEAMTHYENTINQLTDRYNQLAMKTQNLYNPPEPENQEEE